MTRLRNSGLLVIILLLCLSGIAHGITREEVMVRARAYAYHPWRCTSANLTASCSSAYKSEYIPGDYMGLPYDWGGYMTLFSFDQQISKGYGAGSYSKHGVLACTAGLDCSGYVSKCWDAGHWSTSTLHNVSNAISKASMLPGDVFNKAGYHVVLYSHKLGNGDPVFYEAAGYNVHINVSSGWSYVSSYTPRRYTKITGSTASNPLGTLQNPIIINTFPYSNNRDTSSSPSDVLDGCAKDPTKDESGPEFVYQVTFKTPGDLTVSISDGAGVDIDPHLYSAKNTNNCVARHDATFTYAVDCGTYYIVADTFRSSGVDHAGPYKLTALFSPKSKPCGSGPPGYHPKGKMGDKCAYPGNKNLPFCNHNLGAEVCIYTSSTSFCSKPCKKNADCTVFPGGCCKDFGKGEFYCVLSSLCPKPTKDSGGPATDKGAVLLDAGKPHKDGGTKPPQDGGGKKDVSSSDAKGDLLVVNSDTTPGAVDTDDASCSVTGARRGGSAPWPLLVLVSLLFFWRRPSR